MLADEEPSMVIGVIDWMLHSKVLASYLEIYQDFCCYDDCHVRNSEIIVHVADLASSSIIGPSDNGAQWRLPFLQQPPSMRSNHAIPALFCTCECLIDLIPVSAEQNCRDNDMSDEVLPCKC